MYSRSGEDARWQEIDRWQGRLNDARDGRDAWGVGNERHAGVEIEQIIRCRRMIHELGGIVRGRDDEPWDVSVD